MNKVVALVALWAAWIFFTAQAQAETYFKESNWAVTESGPSCTLLGFFESKKVLWVRYTYDLDEALVTLTSPNFESADPSKTYLINVDFVATETFAKRYPLQSFKGAIRGDDRGVEQKFPAGDFLRQLEQSRLIAFWLNNKTVLASLNLRGSQKAVAALRKCAKKVAKIYPSDPLNGNEIPSFPGRK